MAGVDDPYAKAAMGYAYAGWWVYPLRRRTKLPVALCPPCHECRKQGAGAEDCTACRCGSHDDAWPCHGYRSATSDPRRVWQWWTGPFRGHNIAFQPARSGVAVIDYDPRNDPAFKANQAGKNIPIALDVLEERLESVFDDTLRSWTGGGGLHCFFSTDAMPDHTKIAKHLEGLAGIDFLHDKCGVVLPPSLHPDGKRYRWDGTHQMQHLPRNLAIDPEPDPPPRPARAMGTAVRAFKDAGDAWDRAARYCEAALTAAIDRVATAPQGDRNNTLAHTAYGLGQIIGGGMPLDENEVVDKLTDAYTQCGLTHREGAPALTRNLTQGKRSPKTPDWFRQ
ncbi:bifunctional DNA primase/polymerase [Streptoverticillium reticulum]|uniref:bifunctional DNA primase/polymerase n=1 Tax=Streptoverticillium reticulum TaxID=1433415 RepID=UPI0039BFC9ED